MSEFDAQRVAERIDIVLDILVAGDYHSAIHNLEILKAELLRQVAELRQHPEDTVGDLESCLQVFHSRMPGASVFFYLVL